MVASCRVLANSEETTLYVSDQERAMESNVGLWSGEFVRPWVWRIKN